METTKLICQNGSLIPWDEAKIHVLTHSLHYGGGVFEGVRVYKAEKGPAIFRLKEHTERLFYSANCLKLQPKYSQDEINQAILKTVGENELEHGYIRPLIYFGYGKMGLNPKGVQTEVSISCWPWGAYLPHDMVDLKTSSYIRIHPKSSITDAKITGHYVNSIVAVQELEGTHYHEALFLDFEGNVAEGPGENLFIVKNNKIFTPPLGTILAGITRSTVMEIASTKNIEVEEKVLQPSDIQAADEAFYSGTAAEITPIKSLDDVVIGEGKIGPITSTIQTAYMDAVHGRLEGFEHYLSYT